MRKTPALSDVLRGDIDGVIERYRSTINVSERERVQKLLLVADQAKHLLGTLSGLDSGTRRTIVEPVMTSRYAVDPITLIPLLKMLIAQVETAKRRSPKPRRGPHRRDSLRQLIVDLGLLWSANNPSLKGIAASKGERRGPMLDFVWGELKRARIPIQSRDALGKLLYSMRAFIIANAKAVRRKKTVTRRIGSITVMSRG